VSIERGTPAAAGSPSRMPWWRLVLLGFVRAFQGLVTHPLARMWSSEDPIDAYGLNHMASVAGDALLAVALSDSIFFSVPVGQARLRVTAYLLLTMLPLALAGPLMAPILDRAGPRRSITFGAAAARAGFAILLAPRLATNWLFPLALAILVCSKVHTIAKNALTMVYASKQDGLMRANARLGRVGVAGAITAIPFGLLALKAIDPAAPLYVAAAIYGASALLVTRLPHPGRQPRPPKREDQPDRAPMGRVLRLQLPAMGSAGMRAAAGFLLFLLAFALRGEELPVLWFTILAGAGVLGGLVGDIVAPSLRTDRREEAVVITAVTAAGIGALLASQLFGLPLLTVYAFSAGAVSEFARLAFQALMQRHAPPEALGRVFVRYEVVFQVAWVLGAFVPVLFPISFRLGMVFLAAFYGTLAAIYLVRLRRRRGNAPPLPG
jgi:Major Facilitator Superfamily